MALGVFRTVYVSYLPIGHTHADIDQAFSSISSKIRCENAFTMEERIAVVRNCYGPGVRAEEMLDIPNFSGLCENTNCLLSVKGLNFTQNRFFKFEVDDGSSWNGYSRTKCWSKIQESQEWHMMRADGRGFLHSIPDFSQNPDVETKSLPNRAEINIFLGAAEQRVNNEDKMRSLYILRDRIYRKRNIPFAWDLTSAIELNGDYRNFSAGASDDQLALCDGAENGPISDRYGYNNDEFVVLKAPEGFGPFWIARIKTITERDSDNSARKILVRWYQPGNDESNPFMAPYKPAWKVGRGVRKVVYEDEVDVSSVLVRF